MKHILLVDLVLGLSRLLDAARFTSGEHAALSPLLARSHAWQLVEPDLRELLATAEGLPEGLTRTPFAEELGTADALFDGVGRSVRSVLDAHIDHPRVEPGMRALLVRLRDTFVPELSQFSATYLDEGRHARAVHKLLGAREADARSIPVAFGGTLYDWIADFVEQGLTILDLLDRRALAVASVTKDDRRRASTLRATIIDALGTLRAGLDRESRRDPELAALAPALLGFFDMMEQTRTPASKSAPPLAEGGTEPEAPEQPEITAPPALA
jgi:hypothetical protein